MLRKTRRIVAAIFFVLVTLLFLDFTGAAHLWFGWLAKIQLVPAILAVNVAIIIGLALLTLIFGRIYCSVICPLGVMQDGISFVSGKRKGKKNRFRFSKAISWLRYSVLGVFIIGLIAGIPAIFGLLEPYSAYGRIASNLFAPVYRWGNNLLAVFAERADSYAFYPTEVWVKSWVVFGVAIATLIIVAILAWRNGRTYCNTICPVGTFLGFISRFSILKPTFDTEKCTKCGVCERNCKSSCINSKTMTIDQSRCVTCFDCIDKCKFGAMKYEVRKAGKKEIAASTPSESKESKGVKDSGMTRSAFLSIAGLFAFTHTIKAQQLHVDGGLAEIEDKKRPDRKTPVVPPGAKSLRNMNNHCTACQLCVSACPNHVLRPSEKLSTLMQPEMSYEKGFCRPECSECAQVCPADVITLSSLAEKSSIAIGQAIWIKENCIVNTDEVQCTACQQHCPTGAILLVDRDPGQEKSLKIPVVDKELCIGCGACEYLCPARPFSAIYVEGYVKHHEL
ncbi:4Fe-4S binding protein [Bacteroides sp. 51]|uniref:4Fe-4S binding protein n=1 Tax=Bacteroides sp. 51 TaxID=2302938 RepID=UPI0013D6A02A|nr:4Fe-4S binding protein [Bacteroides sp. 51]NDV82514.1 4Fe-4S dicluster domain-containing protein [Bacteroides sp. 51]